MLGKRGSLGAVVRMEPSVSVSVSISVPGEVDAEATAASKSSLVVPIMSNYRKWKVSQQFICLFVQMFIYS